MEELEDETEEEPEEEDGDRFTILLFDNLFSYIPLVHARKPAMAYGPNKQRKGLQLPCYSLLVGGCCLLVGPDRFILRYFLFFLFEIILRYVPIVFPLMFGERF